MVHSIDRLLQHDKLHKIHKKVQLLQYINLQLDAVLDPTLRVHCAAANFEGRRLTLQLDDNVWVLQLSAVIPDIIAFLKTDRRLKNISEIKWRVRPKP